MQARGLGGDDHRLLGVVKILVLILSDFTHSDIRGEVRDSEDQPGHPVRRHGDLTPQELLLRAAVHELAVLDRERELPHNRLQQTPILAGVGQVAQPGPEHDHSQEILFRHHRKGDAAPL